MTGRSWFDQLTNEADSDHPSPRAWVAIVAAAVLAAVLLWAALILAGAIS